MSEEIDERETVEGLRYLALQRCGIALSTVPESGFDFGGGALSRTVPEAVERLVAARNRPGSVRPRKEPAGSKGVRSDAPTSASAVRVTYTTNDGAQHVDCLSLDDAPWVIWCQCGRQDVATGRGAGRSLPDGWTCGKENFACPECSGLLTGDGVPGEPAAAEDVPDAPALPVDMLRTRLRANPGRWRHLSIHDALELLGLPMMPIEELADHLCRVMDGGFRAETRTDAHCADVWIRRIHA